MDRLSVSNAVKAHLPRLLFPSGASQIVTAEQRGHSPRGEPKYPGNQASFSLRETSSIPDALCCLLFPLSSSPPILSASEHYKRSISSL